MNSRFCHIYLSCANENEAALISNKLLEMRLIACAKQFPVSSRYVWKNAIESADEVLLLIDSREDLFGDIEKVVSENHSYETIALTSMPIIDISKSTADWLNESLKPEKDKA